MMRRATISFSLARPLLLLALLAGGALSAQAVDFDTEVYPILRSKCFKCHSGPKAKNGLRYDDKRTLAEFIDGEDKVIVSGNPRESVLLIKAMLPRDDTDAMPPPRRGDPLTSDEIRTIAQWIEEGASLEAGTAEMTEGEGGTTDAPASTEPEIHTWVNTDGNQVKAGFVRLEGSTVVLLLDTGSEFPYEMSRLSPESQALARKLAEGGE